MTALASLPESGAELRVISQKYRLESLLGEGGMGSVWRAFNLQLEVPVAIKLLRAGLDSQELGERLRVEARAAAKLVHPSIVRVFDIGEAESGEPFIVMELLTGESLGEALERGPLPAESALQLLLPIAEALSLAHSRGVVHRDLKPDNIFLAVEGEGTQPKLLDFGIAKVTSTVAAGGATLTQTGTLLGSPEYMSPEQASAAADIDARSDVWAFCVVLYETLSGAAPFTGSSCHGILRAVLQDDPVPLDLFTAVDARLSDIVMRGLAKDRELRHASIFELGQELAAWLYERGVQEDVTGASLEAKWLGRSSESMILNRPRSGATPRAQHDHATLVSVVHPIPRAPSEPLLELPIRRSRRWVPTALVAGAVLFAGAGWASFATFQTQRLPFSAGQAQAASTTPALAARVSAAQAVVALAAPLTEAPTTPSSVSAAAAAPLPPSSPSDKLTAPKTRLTATSAQLGTVHQSVVPATPSLPQALPSRDPAQELLDPY